MTTKNDVTELREILFDTIRKLKDKDNPMDIDRAEAINHSAQTIINTAKVEVDYIRATGAMTQTDFLPVLQIKPVAPLQNGSYVHKIGDRHS